MVGPEGKPTREGGQAGEKEKRTLPGLCAEARGGSRLSFPEPQGQGSLREPDTRKGQNEASQGPAEVEDDVGPRRQTLHGQG